MNFDNPDEWLEEHLAIKAMTLGEYFAFLPVSITTLGAQTPTNR